MIRFYGRVEGGVFEPLGAKTDDEKLVGQRVVMSWVDYDEDAEETELHCEREFTLQFEQPSE